MEVQNTTPMMDMQGNVIGGGEKKETLVNAQGSAVPEKKATPVHDRVIDWPDFIKQSTAKDVLVPFSNIIQLKASDSVRTTLWTLIKHKIQSMPVYNENTGKYVGMVDVFDLVHYIVSMAGDALLRPNFFQGFKNHTYANEPVSKIINISNRDHWFTVMDTSPLSTVLDVLVSSNLHRLPVIDNRRRVIGLITQSKVVEFLTKNIHKFPEFTKSPISQLGLGTFESVFSIADTAPCVTAFTTMLEKGVRGLAVVNAQGQLVDAISASDIKGLIYGDFFSDLRLPVLRYLSKARILLGRNLGPIYCTPNDTLETIMRRLCLEKIHRVFVVDAERKPVHVISLRDILRVVCSSAHSV